MIRRQRAAREAEELLQLLRKLLGVERMHRARGDRIGARRAADAEVDAARVQRLERVKRLGDAQRRMVRQHDAARADANARRRRRDVLDQDLGRRAARCPGMP